MTRAHLPIAALLVLALAGCDTTSEKPAATPSTASAPTTTRFTQAALSVRLDPTAQPDPNAPAKPAPAQADHAAHEDATPNAAAHAHAAAPKVEGGAPMRVGERLVAVREDGALLFGTLQEALPNTDSPRLLALRLVKDGRPLALPKDLGLVFDARFLPNTDTMLAINELHELVQVRGEALTRLDTEAQPPLAISPSGAHIAYAHGQMPFFDVVLLTNGQRTIASGEYLLCWSPAVNDRGDVAFMSSSSVGHGELYLAPHGGKPERLTHRVHGIEIPTPTGPSAPLLLGDTLFFENERGLHMLPLKTQAKAPLQSAWLIEDAHDLVWDVRGQRVWSHTHGVLREHTLPRGGAR